MNNKRIAVLDLGTNLFKLLILEINNNHYKYIYQQKEPVKMGHACINEGYINDEAWKRAEAAIEKLSKSLNHYKVNNFKAVGTSAFRSASNGYDLCQLIRDEYNIDMEIIDGDQEAELIYKGVKQAIKMENKNTVIMDIGGGSDEFIICNEEDLLWKKSLDIGAQRLYDNFHIHDPIPEKNLQALNEHLADHFSSIKPFINQYKPEILIGCSGTFDTICEIYYRRYYHDFKYGLQTGYEIPLEAVKNICQELINAPREKRRQMPGMKEMRVDMISVACYTVLYFIELCKIRRIKISAFGMNEGIAAAYF